MDDISIYKSSIAIYLASKGSGPDNFGDSAILPKAESAALTSSMISALVGVKSLA